METIAAPTSAASKGFESLEEETRIALTGVLGEARAEALTHVAEAKAALSGLDLPEQRGEALDLVADGVVERYA